MPKRPLYLRAVKDMLDRTDHPHAPVVAGRGGVEAVWAREGDRDGYFGG